MDKLQHVLKQAGVKQALAAEGYSAELPVEGGVPVHVAQRLIARLKQHFLPGGHLHGRDTQTSHHRHVTLRMLQDPSDPSAAVNNELRSWNVGPETLKLSRQPVSREQRFEQLVAKCALRHMCHERL